MQSPDSPGIVHSVPSREIPQPNPNLDLFVVDFGKHVTDQRPKEEGQAARNHLIQYFPVRSKFFLPIHELILMKWTCGQPWTVPAMEWCSHPLTRLSLQGFVNANFCIPLGTPSLGSLNFQQAQWGPLLWKEFAVRHAGSALDGCSIWDELCGIHCPQLPWAEGTEPSQMSEGWVGLCNKVGGLCRWGTSLIECYLVLLLSTDSKVHLKGLASRQ